MMSLFNFVLLLLATTTLAEDDFFEMEDRCDSSNQFDSYSRMHTAMNTLHSCIEDSVDFNLLLSRSQEAKKFSQLRRIFENVCLEIPMMRQCASDFVETISPCYNETQRLYFKLLMDRSNKATDLMCNNNGKRLANFIYQGGPQCLAKLNQELMDCMDNVIFKTNEFEASYQPFYLLNHIPECRDTDRMRKCFDVEVKKCNSPTISIFVHTIAKHVVICKKRGEIVF